MYRKNHQLGDTLTVWNGVQCLLAKVLGLLKVKTLGSFFFESLCTPFVKHFDKLSASLCFITLLLLHKTCQQQAETQKKAVSY